MEDDLDKQIREKRLMIESLKKENEDIEKKIEEKKKEKEAKSKELKTLEDKFNDLYEDDTKDIRYYNNRINELKNQIDVIKLKIEREKNK